MSRMRKAVRAVIVRDNKLLVMQRNKFGDVYYTLIGGGVEHDETLEEALVREAWEETGLVVDPESIKLVFIEEAGDPYGTQYVFKCEAKGEQIALGVDSEEALVHAEGENLYTPMWLSVDELPNVTFRSEAMKKELHTALKDGFPSEVKSI